MDNYAGQIVYLEGYKIEEYPVESGPLFLEVNIVRKIKNKLFQFFFQYILYQTIKPEIKINKLIKPVTGTIKI